MTKLNLEIDVSSDALDRVEQHAEVVRLLSEVLARLSSQRMLGFETHRLKDTHGHSAGYWGYEP